MQHDVLPFIPATPKVAYGWRLPNGRNAEIATLPEELGWTQIVQHPVREGVRFSEVRTHPFMPVTFSTRQKVPHASLTLSFQWAGTTSARHPGIEENVSRLDRFRLLRLVETDDISDYENLTGATNDVMTLTMSPERLAVLLDGQNAPALIEQFCTGHFAPSLHELRSTPAIRHTLRQIRENPYQGGMAALYVEAKILELLAEAFTGLAERDTPAERFGSGSRRAVMAARDLLMSDLCNPPSMEDLARNVGVSQHRLNELFREIFGATPFQCLTQWRLDQARVMLSSGDLSVKQVAHLMGYAHVSSFSHAFSRRFGTPPMRSNFS